MRLNEIEQRRTKYPVSSVCVAPAYEYRSLSAILGHSHSFTHLLRA